MRFPRNVKIFRGQLDAAPFLGVLFVLLLFLTLQSRLVHTPGVKINLPEMPQSVAATADSTLAVAVDRNGQYYFEQQLLSEDALVEKLRQRVENARTPPTLIVHADQEANLNASFRLWQLASQLGFREMLIAGRPPGVTVPPTSAQAPLKRP